MKGGRIVLPSEYFTGEDSNSHSADNVDGSSRNQLNCENFVGPDLHVNGGQSGGRRRRKEQHRQVGFVQLFTHMLGKSGQLEEVPRRLRSSGQELVDRKTAFVD